MRVLKFFSEVRQELYKVTWLGRKETLTATMIVLLVTVVFSLLFVLVDFTMFRFVQFISSLGIN